MRKSKTTSEENIAKMIRDGFVKTYGHKAKPGQVDGGGIAYFVIKFGGIEGVANATYRVTVARA